MLEELEKCKVCPRKCGVNRLNKQIGDCKARDKVEISLVSLHMFEEPCISGVNGKKVLTI